MQKSPARSGFTLIELSIVLVIIGLIIGGILTGQDLINAAAMRAQISQIEHYNTAVRTFQGKYGYLPGDIPNPFASQFGFVPRGNFAGEGDGNGIIQGISSNGAGDNYGELEWAGETVMFWVDLSAAGLIEGTFNTASPSTLPSPVSGAALNKWFPQAKIGNGNFIAISSGGYSGPDGTNYYSIAAVTQLIAALASNPGLSVLQAYNIDSKVDDGLPQSGNVLALNNGLFNGDSNFVNIGGNAYTILYWAAAPGYSGAACGTAGEGNCVAATNAPTTAATAGTSLTCYDNGGVAGVEKYSIGQNGGGSINCALSFKFQ